MPVADVFFAASFSKILAFLMDSMRSEGLLRPIPGLGVSLPFPAHHDDVFPPSFAPGLTRLFPCMALAFARVAQAAFAIFNLVLNFLPGKI